MRSGKPALYLVLSCSVLAVADAVCLKQCIEVEVSLSTDQQHCCLRCLRCSLCSDIGTTFLEVNTTCRNFDHLSRYGGLGRLLLLELQWVTNPGDGKKLGPHAILESTRLWMCRQVTPSQTLRPHSRQRRQSGLLLLVHLPLLDLRTELRSRFQDLASCAVWQGNRLLGKLCH